MFTPKIWLRLGVFAVAGSSAAASPQLMRPTQSGVEIKTAIDQVDASGSLVLAEKQRRGSEEEGGEGGEAGETRAHRLPNASKNIQEHKRTLQPRRGSGGEGGEGGERGPRPRSEGFGTKLRAGQGGEAGKGGSRGSTRVTSSGSPKVPIPRERARKKLKTTCRDGLQNARGPTQPCKTSPNLNMASPTTCWSNLGSLARTTGSKMFLISKIEMAVVSMVRSRR